MNLGHLNIQQQEAIQKVDGHILVLAGAGTGKTTVLTHRIAYLIEQGVEPDKILAITFTNKAAKEMKNRVFNLLDKQENEKQPFISTFHSFCFYILKKYCRKVGFFPNFTIQQPSDQRKLMKEILSEMGLESETKSAYTFLNAVSKAKSKLLYEVDGDLKYSQEVYEKYQDRLKMMNSMDFDDLLFFAYKLWKDNPEILEEAQEQFTYILVDEFQDTNYAQFALCKLLAEKNKNLFVVGDDDQSIYTWRGAEIENILNFPSIFENTFIVKLQQNYRSTNTILKAANAVIAKNSQRYKKNLFSSKDEGNFINVYKSLNPSREAEYICHTINHKIANGDVYKNFAIIFRANQQSRILEEKFIKYGIPYTLVGDQSFFDKKEIRDTVAYLQLIMNLDNDLAFSRIINTPSRSIGLTSISNAREFAERNSLSLFKAFQDNEFLQSLPKKTRNSVIDFIDVVLSYQEKFMESEESLFTLCYQYLDEIGFLSNLNKVFRDIKEEEERKNNVIELLNAIQEFEDNEREKSLDAFLATLNLNEQSFKRRKVVDDKELIMGTVHSLKGLEFKTVFVVGMEEDLFPHINAIQEESVEEERRLFYVALTRAKQNIFLSWNEHRISYGKEKETLASSFISEIPIEYRKFINQEKTTRNIEKIELSADAKKIWESIMNKKNINEDN